MEKLNGFSPDRNILCLFDVDGTLTPPREVRVLGFWCRLPHCYSLTVCGGCFQSYCVIAVRNFAVTSCNQSACKSVNVCFSPLFQICTRVLIIHNVSLSSPVGYDISGLCDYTSKNIFRSFAENRPTTGWVFANSAEESKDWHSGRIRLLQDSGTARGWWWAQLYLFYLFVFFVLFCFVFGGGGLWYQQTEF